MIEVIALGGRTSFCGISALGHKQTLEQASEMSALPTRADMRLAVQRMSA